MKKFPLHMLNSFPIRNYLYTFYLKFLITITTVLFLSIAVVAQKDTDKLVVTGLEHCYNFKWENAEQTFRKIIEKSPLDPKGYHYLSSVYFWYFLSNKHEADLENFKKYSDEAINLSTEYLSANKKDASMLYLLGSSYNYRTVAFARAGNYLDAVWAAKKSESYLSDCIESDSAFYDAYLGLGLYNFAVANIPMGFKWALNLAGISGEENTGLQYLKIAAEKGKVAKVEAQYYLSQILMEALMDYETSSAYLKNLTKKFPDNLLFNYSNAVVNIKKRKLGEAEKILLKLINKEEEKFTQIISLSNFLLGDIYFRRNEFEKAQKYYMMFLASAKDNEYTGIASYRLAITFESAGERENAINYFLLSENGNMDIEDDIYAKRKGAVYTKRTLAKVELDLIKSTNIIEAGKYQEALDTLVNLLSNLKTEKLKAEIYYLISEASFHLGRYNESIDYALNAVKLNISEENWINPFSYFNAARASMMKGNSEEAEKFISQAQDYSGYDYQNKLEHMIDALAKKFFIF